MNRQELAEQLSNVSNEFLVEGQYGKAQALMFAAIMLDEQNAKWHVGLGIIFSLSGEGNKAIFEFEKALQLDPEHTSALSLLGGIYQKQGNFERAIDLLEHNLLIHEAKEYDYNSALINNLCKAYIESGKREKAKALIEKYIIRYPKDENLLRIRIQLGLH